MPRRNKRNKRRMGRKTINNRNNNRDKKFGAGGNLAIIRNPLSSDSMLITLKYFEIVNLAPGASFFEYIYTGNGAFDPNVTGTGVQPAGYDQWADLYTRYLCLGSRIRLAVVNNSTTNNAAISIFPTDQTSGVTDFSSATAQPYSCWKVMNFTGSISKLVLNNRMTTSKIWGKDCRYDDLFSAGTGNNPSNLWYWCINGDSQPGGNIAVTMYVEIWYKLLFYKRVAPDLSLSAYAKRVPPEPGFKKEFKFYKNLVHDDEKKNCESPFII